MGNYVSNSNILVTTSSANGRLVRHAVDGARQRRAKAHKIGALDRAASLAGLIGRFGAGAIVEDPTGAFERARRLVIAARKTRQAAKGKIATMHLGPNGRTLFVRVRAYEDLMRVAPLAGDIFARTLAGTGLELAIVVRLEAPPKGSLRVEQVLAQAKSVARHARAASAALAASGFATVAYAQPAAADSAEAVIMAQSADAMPSHMPAMASAPPRRPLTPLSRLSIDTSALCAANPPLRMEGVRLVLSANDTARIVELHNPVGPDAARLAAFANTVDPTALRGSVLEITGLEGEQIVSVTRYGVQPDGGDYFDLQVAMCTPAPAQAAPEAAPVAEAAPDALNRDYREVAGEYINRTVQQGQVGALEGQWALGDSSAINVQGAVGQIDSQVAVGGQVAWQDFRPMFNNTAEGAIGGFVSAVRSEAPNRETLSIARAGVGLSVMLNEVQLIVRGGYAAGHGYTDRDGGFLRAEAAWFPIDRLGLDVMIEDDPITGTGAGVGASARPFTGVLSNLMIDADAAWHDEGEESFRLSVRWLIGDAASTTERQRRRQRGMAPVLPQEFERLPEEDKNANSQSYCGGATGVACAT